MEKTIYYLGSPEIGRELLKGLQIIGWKLESFKGWDVHSPIIYQLSNIEVDKLFIPDNLLIITNNPEFKKTNNRSIFYLNGVNLGINFSRFLLQFIKGINKSFTNFYDSREVVNLLYFRESSNSDKLFGILEKSKQHLIRKFKFSNYQLEQPVKTLIFIENFNCPSIRWSNIPSICLNFNKKQKKELKSQNPLVPKLFINKINKSTIKKILHLLD